MKTDANASAANTNAPGTTPQPPAPGDWPSMLAVMAGVLTGLAGDRTRLRVTSDLESVAAPNLLIPGQHLRLLTLLSRITDGAKELQTKLVAASSALRTDLLQELCGGPRQKKRGGGEVPLLVREKHICALQAKARDEHSESSALENLHADVAQGRLALREDALHRPLMMLNNPETKALTDLVAGCHGGRALVLGDMPETTRPIRKRFMRLLQGTTVTVPAALRRGLAGDHTALIRASAVMSINPGDIEMLVNNDPVFLSQFVIVQPGGTGGLCLPAANGTKIPIPETMWLELFSGAAARVMAGRRSGVQLEGWLRDAEAAREFQGQRQAFMEELEASGDPAASVFAELPMAIAWLLTQLFPNKPQDDHILYLAVSGARQLWRRHAKLLSGSTQVRRVPALR